MDLAVANLICITLLGWQDKNLFNAVLRLRMQRGHGQCEALPAESPGYSSLAKRILINFSNIKNVLHFNLLKQ
jgi:hypothetical protein